LSRRPCVGGHKNCKEFIVNTERSGVCLAFPATKIHLHDHGKRSSKSLLFNLIFQILETRPMGLKVLTYTLNNGIII